MALQCYGRVGVSITKLVNINIYVTLRFVTYYYYSYIFFIFICKYLFIFLFFSIWVLFLRFFYKHFIHIHFISFKLKAFIYAKHLWRQLFNFLDVYFIRGLYVARILIPLRSNFSLKLQILCVE